MKKFNFYIICIILSCVFSKKIWGDTLVYIQKQDNGKFSPSLPSEYRRLASSLKEVQVFYQQKKGKKCLKLLKEINQPLFMKEWIISKNLDCAKLLSKKARIIFYKNYLDQVLPIDILKYPTNLVIQKKYFQALLEVLSSAVQRRQKAVFWKWSYILQNPHWSLPKPIQSDLYLLTAWQHYNEGRGNTAREYIKKSIQFGLQKRKIIAKTDLPKLLKTGIDTRNLHKTTIEILKQPFGLEKENKSFNLVLKNRNFLKHAIEFLIHYPDSIRSSWLWPQVLRRYQSVLRGKNKSQKIFIKKKILGVKCFLLERLSGKLFYRGFYSEVIRLSRFVDLSCSSFTPLRLLLWGKSHYYRGEYKIAEDLFLRLVEKYSGHSATVRGLLMLGILKFKQSKFNDSVKYFKLILVQNTSEYKLEAHHWLWRIYSLKGIIKLKNKHAQKLIDSYFLTYYGLRAYLETHGEVLKIKPFEREILRFNLEPQYRLSWKRAAVLLKASWQEEARHELVQWSVPIFPYGAVSYAYLLNEGGDHLKSIKILNKVWGENPKLRNYFFLQLLFPQPYKKLVTTEAKRNGLTSELVFSVMRQESAFFPKAESSMKAYGLMQMILSTAKSVGRILKFKNISKELLFDPSINVKLGTRHLRQLLKQWNRHIPLSLAAYNAGHGNINLWLAGYNKKNRPKFVYNSHFENEIWFEELPWRETNGYIKSILRNYMIYKLLNQSSVDLDFIWKQ